MKKISICGIDGSGKTTLLREIGRIAADAGAPVAVLRAPQYFDAGDLGVNRLARKLEDLGARADEAGLPALKACALFLGMTLYGAAESELAAKRPCRALFREREPIADSLAYAQFYVRLLREPFPRALVEAYGDAEIEGYLGELLEREALGRQRLTFEELPMYVRAVFSTPWPDVVPILERLYGTSTADAIVLLRLTPERMKERMAQKASEGAGRGPELHEKHEILVGLQAGLEKAIAALRAMKPIDLEPVDVDDRPAARLAHELLQRYAG